MNVLGILGADPDVRNGYRDIRVRFEIDADAPPDEIEALVAQSQKRSAVFDVDHQPDQRRRRRRLSDPPTGDAPSRRRHRCRPRRPGHESPPHRALDRPRRDRARCGGELVAHATVGLAAPADAELARQTSRAQPPAGRHPDGYMTVRRGCRAHRALRRRPSTPRSSTAPRSPGSAGTATATRSSPTAVSGRARRRSIASGGCAAASGASVRRRAAIVDHVGDAARPTAAPVAARRRRARRRGVGDRRPARRRDPRARDARSRWRSASTSACHVPTAGATSSGGPRPPASSTSATTRSTTSCAPGTCRHRS